jgi:hypothetical protein
MVIRALAKIIIQFERAVDRGLTVLAKFMEEVAEH